MVSHSITSPGLSPSSRPPTIDDENRTPAGYFYGLLRILVERTARQRRHGHG
jgi:hypothetical protein